MLRAFFDESGHAADQNIVSIGGFLGTAEEWLAFDTKWQELLATHGIREFHASKISADHGVCKGWSRDRINALMSDVVSAITSRDLLGISHSIIVPDFQLVVGRHSWFSMKFGSPYQLCYEASIQAAARWIQRNPKCEGDRVEVVFASNLEHGGAARIEGERYVKHERYAHLISDVMSAAARDVPGLQAADLLAYETFKYSTAHFYRRPNPEPRRSYRRFFEEMAMAPPGYWDAESLCQFCLIIAHEEPGLSTRERVALTRYLIATGDEIARANQASTSRD